MEQKYGDILKVIMKDKRITISAKGIYAYFCSYQDETLFPDTATMICDLGISRETFNKNIKLLKEYGYLEVIQERINGAFSRNVYKICEDNLPDSAKPETEKPTTIKPNSETPSTEIPSTVKPTTEKPITAKTAPANIGSIIDITNNKYKNINKNNINIITNSQSVSLFNAKKESQPIHYDLVKPSTKNNLDNYTTIKAKIQENVCFNAYFDYYEKVKREGNNLQNEMKMKNKVDLMSDMIEIMIDAILSKGDIKIGSEIKSSEQISSVFLKLSEEQFAFAYNQFINIKSKVINKKAYIRTILYNSYFECKAEEENIFNVYAGS